MKEPSLSQETFRTWAAVRFLRITRLLIAMRMNSCSPPVEQRET